MCFNYFEWLIQGEEGGHSREGIKQSIECVIYIGEEEEAIVAKISREESLLRSWMI